MESIFDWLRNKRTQVLVNTYGALATLDLCSHYAPMVCSELDLCRGLCTPLALLSSLAGFINILGATTTPPFLAPSPRRPCFRVCATTGAPCNPGNLVQPLKGLQKFRTNAAIMELCSANRSIQVSMLCHLQELLLVQTVG